MRKQKLFPPVIKWSGSKRTQAHEIIKHFPKFDRYFEPFLGGGSVLYALLQRDKTVKAFGNDVCKPLIDFWNVLKNDPESVLAEYDTRWNFLQEEGHTYFYKVRDVFNRNQGPHDLLFLSRTCVNGLIRFNKNGEFNNSLHHTRKGIAPERLKRILFDWSESIQDVTFSSDDYQKILSEAKTSDFVYLDPPYFHTNGRYYGKINYNKFLQFLQELNGKGVKYALSFDGKRGEKDYTAQVPKNLYKTHIYIRSGNSSFKKVMDKQNQEVQESLYLNY